MKKKERDTETQRGSGDDFAVKFLVAVSDWNAIVCGCVLVTGILRRGREERDRDRVHFRSFFLCLH